MKRLSIKALRKAGAARQLLNEECAAAAAAATAGEYDDAAADLTLRGDRAPAARGICRGRAAEDDDADGDLMPRADRAAAARGTHRARAAAEDDDDDDDFSADVDANTPYSVTTGEMQAVINALGFKDYLLTLSSNMRSANTTISRTAELLRFLLVLAHAGAVVAAFVALDTRQVLAFLKDLKERLGRSNSTVYNILLDVKQG